jgi:hypothetical protein
MATTTNYGWDTPDDTDLVKDGALAMRDLGQDIDTSLFGITDGKNVGMVHINTTTFSSVASVSVDNVFTTAFDNYKIIFNLSAFSGATETDLLMYLRAGGTDTTTNYVTERLYQESTTIGANRVTTGRIGYMSTTYPTFTNCDITIYGPKQTRKTVWTSHGFYIQNSGIPNQALTSGYQDTTTAFDGIKIYPNTGTSISGTFRIYGLRNS